MAELRWRADLTDAEVTQIEALTTAATASDDIAPLSEHVLLHVRHGGDAGAAHLLGYDGSADGAELVAFAHLDLTDRVAGAAGEFVVHPERRREGIGTLVAQTLLDRAAAADTPGELRLWAHGDHPGAAALARRLGFDRARILWQMRRSLLMPIGEPRLPDGVRLRPFVVGVDEPEFLRVNNAAFDWHPEQGGWDLRQVEVREAEPWFDPDGFLLAVAEDGRLLGFHWTKVHGVVGDECADDRPDDSADGSGDGSGPHPHEAIGEVYVLGVDPEARGLHLGVALTLAGLHHLREQGLQQVLLYVEADNAAAVHVYRNLGFARFRTDVSYVR